MHFIDQICDIERALGRRKIPVARMCRDARIHPTTWVRWKGGLVPRVSTWQRVMDALLVIAPEAVAELQSKGVSQ